MAAVTVTLPPPPVAPLVLMFPNCVLLVALVVPAIAVILPLVPPKLPPVEIEREVNVLSVLSKMAPAS